MILESVIERVVEQQSIVIANRDTGLPRELVPAVQSLASHALIISGVRRCGKSTLLMQMMKGMKEETVYLNFESPRLYGFSLNDFSRLDHVIRRSGTGTLFFDEIQLVQGWEMYVRQKLDEGFRVIITGSNASLLSQEMGSKLTGRHITQELFPFSYSEFLTFRDEGPSAESLGAYMITGGFPEYVKSGDPEQLATLFNDVLIRDIVARYGIRDIRSLQRLASYLLSNTGNRVTATKLKQPLSIGATSTVLSWFSHLEMSCLVSLMPMYGDSVKAQMINPRKVYAIDPGLVEAISVSMSEDAGRKLENVVFLHLRRKYRELYYFDEQGECDFVAMDRGAVAEIVQVCYDLTPDNLDRELNGLMRAMKRFGKSRAIIVTFSGRDRIGKDSFEIDVVPAWEYLTGSSKISEQRTANNE
ncbi:MAG TPA: ATP-binding protein [Bacteroidales bacterium]|nr:ATP-binding protein [Bacteroidales bacterium]